MTAPRVSEAEFIRVLEATGGNIQQTAATVGTTVENARKRRRRIEARTGRQLIRNLACPNPTGGYDSREWAYHPRADLQIYHGTAVVFGDMHSQVLDRRNGRDTPAMEALLNVLELLNTACVATINMGDTADFPSIGRHPPIGKEQRPKVADEIIAQRHDLNRIIERSVHANGRRHWIIGNHDQRLDRILGQRVPELEGVDGMSLAELHPAWRISSAVFVNADMLRGRTKFVHRWHAGIHARSNNVMKGGGGHFVSADTHRLDDTTFRGQFGDWWYSVETGMIADLHGPQFQYTSGVDPNWRAGFYVLSWEDGVLLPPEKVPVEWDGTVRFRGHVVAGSRRTK